ncbi:MAG: LysR family transcriptional regulator [Alphaproteobacteria bacterium]|nr:LysR family transcriptional regulator [Alphaproteobacteria bacterium]
MTPLFAHARSAFPADRLFALAIFARVIETGSFSRAARDLGIGQPTASKQVAAIEALFGIRLIERTTRRLRPTEDGQFFYQHAKDILSKLDELESITLRRSRASGGRLRISCPPALGRMIVAPIIFKYLQTHDDTLIDLDLSSRYLDPIQEGVDLAIRIGEQPSSTYRARLLAPNRRVLVASPAYVKGHGAPRDPGDLERHDMLVYSNLPSPNVLKLRHRSMGLRAVNVSGRLRINNSEVLVSAVLAGIGIACLPHWSVRNVLRAKQLLRLLPAWEPEGTSIHAVFPGGAKMPARVRLFLDFLAEEIRAAI